MGKEAVRCSVAHTVTQGPIHCALTREKTKGPGTQALFCELSKTSWEQTRPRKARATSVSSPSLSPNPYAWHRIRIR